MDGDDGLSLKPSRVVMVDLDESIDRVYLTLMKVPRARTLMDAKAGPCWLLTRWFKLAIACYLIVLYCEASRRNCCEVVGGR